MVDINLLPDELRSREAAERKRLSKTPKVVDFPLSRPLPPDAPRLAHGGSGMGRPVAPKPPPLPPPEPQRAAPPLPQLPKRPERLEIFRSVVMAGAGKPAAVPAIATAPPVEKKPPVKPSAYHLDAKEAATLAAAVKREVASVQRLQTPALPPPGRAKRHGWSFRQWLSHLFSRAPKAKTAPAAHPAVPPPAPPPPAKPAVPRPILPVVVKPPSPPRLPQAKLTRQRRSFLQWLSRLFATKRPVLPVKPRAPKPAPAPPRPVPVPPVLVMVKLPAAPVTPRQPRRPSWWQRLLAWLSRRHKKPALPLVVSRLPAPLLLPPRPPVPVPTPPPVKPVISPPKPPAPVVPPPVVATPVAPPLKVPPPSPPPAPLKPAKPPTPKRPGEHPAGRPFKTLAINLIPEEFARHPELNLSRKFLVYLASLGVAVFALLTVSQLIGLYQYRIGNEIRDTEQRIALLQTQIDNYQGRLDAAKRLEGDLGTMEQLLSRHRYWTQIFAALERHTIDEVFYDTFTTTGDGGLTLAAHGRDFGSVARQLVAFREATDVFSGVKITGASAVVEKETNKILRVSFSVTLAVKPETFTLPLTASP